ncbi:hypothetical protein MNV49_005069 [Pseudohyphozyma bogoriensis]|nr:hypothetical protein MNV49_005069 [Pseudohyphozyma bogoriensis]
MTANSKGEPRAKKPATTTTKAKATATTKGKKKGAAGKLSAFMNVPLDILAEICTHLTPLDLIRLASLSKAFRALLVHSNNCNSIWIRARKQFGLPALQANQALGGMSEWQYAYLVFVKKCHDCNATCHVADFYLRTRLCKSCRKKRIDWYSDHASYNFIKDAHPDLRKCLATSPYSASNWKKEGSLPNVLKADAHFINDQLWEKYREDEATKAKSKSKKETVGNGPLVAKFVEERVALVVKIKSDAKAIQETLTKFEEEEKNAKADKKISDDIIISTRRIAIRQKVMALGYAWSDTNSELWNKSPLVNKAEPLTDDGWKKEKPKIVKLLEKIKESREVEQAAYAKRVRQGRIQTPYYRLKSTEADNARKDYPRFGDFLQLPTVKKFWESSSKSFVQAEWDSQLDKIKNEVDDHREKVRINAIRTILAASQKVDMNTLSTNPRLYPSSKYDDAFFELATSGLFCSLPDCRAKGSFSIDYWDDISDYGYFSDDDFPSPQISYNRPRLVHFSSLSSLLDHQQSYHSEHRPDELIHGHFELPKLCADGVKEMIKLLQLTPATAKIDELEKRGTYFHWTNGANSKKGKWWDTKPLLDAWHHKATGARGRNVDHEAPVITLHTLDLPPKAAPADGKNA